MAVGEGMVGVGVGSLGCGVTGGHCCLGCVSGMGSFFVVFLGLLARGPWIGGGTGWGRQSWVWAVRWRSAVAFCVIFRSARLLSEGGVGLSGWGLLRCG